MNTLALTEEVGLVLPLKHAAKIKLSQVRKSTPTQVSQNWLISKVRKHIRLVLIHYACIKAQVKKEKKNTQPR